MEKRERETGIWEENKRGEKRKEGTRDERERNLKGTWENQWDEMNGGETTEDRKGEDEKTITLTSRIMKRELTEDERKRRNESHRVYVQRHSRTLRRQCSAVQPRLNNTAVFSQRTSCPRQHNLFASKKPAAEVGHHFVYSGAFLGGVPWTTRQHFFHAAIDCVLRIDHVWVWKPIYKDVK